MHERTSLAVLLLLAATAVPAHAQYWPTSATSPVVLSSAPHEKQGLASVGDGSGGSYVAWADHRTSSQGFNIVVQHLLADGRRDPSWPAHGRIVCAAPKDQVAPRLVRDPGGGVFVVWMDARSATTGWDVYGHRVRANGTLDPAWPVNGLAVCAFAQDQGSPDCAFDGVDGLYVAWHDGRMTGRVAIYAQRVKRIGVPDWVAGGIPVSSIADLQEFQPVCLANGEKEFYVVWERTYSTTNKRAIVVNRIRPDGTFASGWLHGGSEATYTAPSGPSLRYPQIALDGTGGVFVTWRETNVGGGEFKPFASRMLGNGLRDTAWPLNGAYLGQGGSGAYPHSVVQVGLDGTGGMLALWTEGGLYESSSRLQRLNLSGVRAVGWPGNGVALAPSAIPGYGPYRSNQEFSVIPDGAGGGTAFFMRQSDKTVRAQRVLPGGSIDPSWPAYGRVVIAYYNAIYGELATVRTGARMICHAITTPAVSGPPYDASVVANRVRADGAVGLHAASGREELAPATPRATVEFATPDPPVAQTTTRLTFTLAAPGHVALHAFDVSGRRVRTLRDESLAAGVHDVHWLLDDEHGERVAAGVYFVRLATDDQALSRRVIVR